MTIRLPSGALDAIAAHARDAAPAECCGILIGRESEIIEAVRCRNLSEDPNRFLIDPQDHFDAIRRARNSNLDVVGFYHSHPHSSPEPSPTDLAEASYPDHLYLIVGLRGAGGAGRAGGTGGAGTTPEFRLYRLRDGLFQTVAIDSDH